MNTYIKGTCMTMCPKEEIELRERERLLHPLEILPGTENSPFPKANQDTVIKRFSRSAAGKIVNCAENLRPSEILLKTVGYLLFDVFNCNQLPFYEIYNFITDRLMAVRQDMVIQNISSADSITILQPIIRFHAYAAYRLCSEKVSNFDPILNNSHLQECLKRLLFFYDSCDCITVDKMIYSDFLLDNRPEFEALYIIFNLGNEEALQRTLTIPKCYKNKVVNDAIKLSICYIFGNYVKMCRIMQNLPPLLSAIASLILPEIRRKSFGIMCIAYHSKNLFFPLRDLKEILLYEMDKELIEDLRYYGVRTENTNIYFSKENFDDNKQAITPKQEKFVDEKFLKEDIRCLLLGA